MRLIAQDALAVITIRQEAENQSLDGKTAVGEVIRERMRRHYNSDGTIAGTICKSFQFSAWNDDWRDNALLIRTLQSDDTDPNVKECIRAWQMSEHSNLVSGAVLYCNLAFAQPSWATDDRFVVKIGDHSFYKD